MGRSLPSLLALLLLAAAPMGCSDDPQPASPGSVDTDADDVATDVADDTSLDTDRDADAGGDVAQDVPETEDVVELDASAFGYGERGPWPVGRLSFVVDDAARQRVVPVTVLYPADPSVVDAAAGEPIEAWIADEVQRQTYADLLASAPDGCPTRRVSAVADAPMASAEASWPLVVVSHCFQCLGLSGASVGVHLASRGMVVALPDHTDDTLFDKLAGAESHLGDAFLQVRAGDVRAVMDVLLSDAAPEPVRGRLDAARVGVMGHSFGAVTTGRVLQLDERPVAGLAIAAPMENPLFPSVHVAEIHRPVMWVLAGEDNSIQEIGNTILRTNFQTANPPAWLVEVADAGHWSFSDLCGLVEAFAPGCGEGTRQTRAGEMFTYLSAAQGIEIVSRYAAAFFGAHLLGEPDGLAALEEAFPTRLVTTATRQ